ncbi:MAG TPA: AAA family ATPase, partial [Tepidisphaeraceae bacterium]|nr:AAA family ATPase [Tepidisphaeraceae bacterium]
MANSLSEHGFPSRYLTLDDAVTLSAAQADPQGFIAGLDSPVIIDEVQRAPALALAIKAAVDADREPERFLLTGSANVLLLPKVSESLAGRIEIHTLWSLSQGELEETSDNFVDALFKTKFSTTGVAAEEWNRTVTRMVQRTHAIPLPIREDRRRPLPEEDCMGYATILGLDLGKFKSVCCVMDAVTGRHAFETLATTPAVIADLLARHAAAANGEEILLVIETCDAAGWVHDVGCATPGVVVTVVHTQGDELEVVQGQTQDRPRRRGVPGDSIAGVPQARAPGASGRVAPAAGACSLAAAPAVAAPHRAPPQRR